MKVGLVRTPPSPNKPFVPLGDVLDAISLEGITRRRSLEIVMKLTGYNTCRLVTFLAKFGTIGLFSRSTREVSEVRVDNAQYEQYGVHGRLIWFLGHHPTSGRP